MKSKKNLGRKRAKRADRRTLRAPVPSFAKRADDRTLRAPVRDSAKRRFFGGTQYLTTENLDKFKTGTEFTRLIELEPCPYTDKLECREKCRVVELKDSNLTYTILRINRTINDKVYTDANNFVIGKIEQGIGEIKQGMQFKILIDSFEGSSTPGSSSTSTPVPSSSFTSNEQPCPNLKLFYDDTMSPEQQKHWAVQLTNKLTNYKNTYVVQGDYYKFFHMIRNGLFLEFKNILHEDGFIKGYTVATQTYNDRMKKFYYLFHVVLSEKQPVTCLQYACMWNRLDFVILILQYLVGASPEFATIYINYAAKFDVGAKPNFDWNNIPKQTVEHFSEYTTNYKAQTALDLINYCASKDPGKNTKSRVVSEVSKFLKYSFTSQSEYITQLGKNFAFGKKLDNNNNIEYVLLCHGAENATENQVIIPTKLSELKQPLWTTTTQLIDSSEGSFTPGSSTPI
jgi:hypothetical protein